MFNNTLFSSRTIPAMHPSMERLYQASRKTPDEQALGQSEIARVLNQSPQVVNNWEVRGVSSKGSLLAQAAFGVNANWLLTGEGPITPSQSNVMPGPDSKGKVPLISWITAGEWCAAEDPHLPGEGERWLDCPVGHSASTFALRVRGDSMTAPHGNSRTYPEGCIIFVDPEQRAPSNGERVVACLEDTNEVTFKVYKNEDGRQWLQPLNPSHEPIRENFKILGKVLGKWEDG